MHDLIYDRIPAGIKDFTDLISGNEIALARMHGVGYLSSEEAIAYSTAGPVLRGSGVNYDIRRAEPYSFYDQLDFDVPVYNSGDLYARYMVRLEEMYESLRILKQVLPRLKETKGGPILSGKPEYSIRAPKGGGDHYGRAENPKGELGFYIKAESKASNLDRYHIRAPSFINLQVLEKMSLGHKLADLVAILGGIDIVLGEVDR